MKHAKEQPPQTQEVPTPRYSALPTDTGKGISNEESGTIGMQDAAGWGAWQSDRTRRTDIDPREPYHADEYTPSPLKPHAKQNQR